MKPCYINWWNRGPWTAGLAFGLGLCTLMMTVNAWANEIDMTPFALVQTAINCGYYEFDRHGAEINDATIPSLNSRLAERDRLASDVFKNYKTWFVDVSGRRTPLSGNDMQTHALGIRIDQLIAYLRFSHARPKTGDFEVVGEAAESEHIGNKLLQSANAYIRSRNAADLTELKIPPSQHGIQHDSCRDVCDRLYTP